jgi:hypothetical protein
MKVSHSSGVYSVTLKEQEWYGVDEVKQATMRAQAQVNAQELGCQYISIMVEPDAVLSISPKPMRHQVWRHTFPLTDEQELYRKLMQLCEASVGPGKLSLTQAREVARRVFG